MAKNSKLKSAILEKDFTQREVAKRTKIPESVLSHHIHGRWVFIRSEKEKIAEVLQVDSREIFDSGRHLHCPVSNDASG